MNRTSRVPSPRAALLLFAIVLTANFASGLVFARLGLPDELFLVAAPILMIVLTLGAVVLLEVDPRETLLLRLPSKADFFMAFPLAISFVVLSDQISLLTDELIPLPPEIEQGLRELVRAESAREWVLKITTIGFGAALSEELLFRGFIQTALLTGTTRRLAVLATSFMFMVVHFWPHLAIAAAGIVLGIAALASKSILVPMFIHFLNNIAALALVNLTDLESLGDPIWIPPTILLPALAIFVLTMGFYVRRLIPEVEAQPPLPDADRENRPVVLPEASGSLGKELEGVPPAKRRLGWLVVAFAILIGVTALLGLFAVSVYFTNPQGVHAVLIESLEEESVSQLAPEARERAPDLTAAFDALSEVNDAGNLRWSEIVRVIVVYAERSADGTLDSGDVDAVMAVIADIVGAVSTPRRL